MNFLVDSMQTWGDFSAPTTRPQTKAYNCRTVPFVPIRQSPRHHPSHSSVACHAMSPQEVKEELEGESLEKWNSCVEKVGGLGLEEEKAETAVGQAFGWGKQSYWLNKKKKEVPKPEQVADVLKYLEEDLELSKEDVSKIVKNFPEVINLNVERRLKANLEHMQKAFYMKQPQAVNTVKRMPSVLGFTVDCEGSCEGLCNQCWVRL